MDYKWFVMDYLIVLIIFLGFRKPNKPDGISLL